MTLLERTLPSLVSDALGSLAASYDVRGSAGQGGWTHTPWVVILDPIVTSSVEEGFYVAYLMSKGGERLYLNLNQGCTTLKNAVGLPACRDTLRSRAKTLWNRVKSSAVRFTPLELDLNVERTVWRGGLYETGIVAGVQYDMANLPSNEEMQADLVEAMRLYRVGRDAGGWDAEDSLVSEMQNDGAGDSLEQAKRYRQHRSIERRASHSLRVKKLLGTRCMGCRLELHEIYGAQATGIIDAHHLIPLHSLADGSVVTFDPKADFAVLCPNCHRVIHKLADPSDLESLRVAIAGGLLSALASKS